MSLKALSALAMTRMYYDGSTDERSSLIEQKRIMEKAQGFLKRRASVAGVLEIRIGSMKGAPVALPRGVGKNPLRNLTSMTPRAAAKQNLLDAKNRNAIEPTRIAIEKQKRGPNLRRRNKADSRGFTCLTNNSYRREQLLDSKEHR